jgi:hypothetical protein
MAPHAVSKFEGKFCTPNGAICPGSKTVWTRIDQWCLGVKMFYWRFPAIASVCWTNSANSFRDAFAGADSPFTAKLKNR